MDLVETMSEGIEQRLAVMSDLGPASIVGLPLDRKPGQAASKIASTVAVRQRRRILR
jgi:hypothetical protein